MIWCILYHWQSKTSSVYRTTSHASVAKWCAKKSYATTSWCIEMIDACLLTKDIHRARYVRSCLLVPLSQDAITISSATMPMFALFSMSRTSDKSEEITFCEVGGWAMVDLVADYMYAWFQQDCVLRFAIFIALGNHACVGQFGTTQMPPAQYPLHH